MRVYIIGSLRNPKIPELGNALRAEGMYAFDDWFGAGHEADDQWLLYEKTRGRSYGEALYGEAAAHIFNFDKDHLDRSDAGVLVMPAGKSGHLELGYLAGKGKETYVLFDGEPERWDCMYQFANKVFFNQDELVSYLKGRADAEAPLVGLPTLTEFVRDYRARVDGAGRAEEQRLRIERRLPRLNGIDPTPVGQVLPTEHIGMGE